VTLFTGHRGSPKVIFQQVFQRNVRPEVTIVPDGRDVIEDEVAGQSVPVDSDAHQEEPSVNETRAAIKKRRTVTLLK